MGKFRSQIYFHWKIIALAWIWTWALPSTKPICSQLSYPGLDIDVSKIFKWHWRAMSSYKHNNTFGDWPAHWLSALVLEWDLSNHGVSLESFKEKGSDKTTDEIIIYWTVQQKIMLGLFTLCLWCTLRVSLQVDASTLINLLDNQTRWCVVEKYTIKLQHRMKIPGRIFGTLFWSFKVYWQFEKQ